MGFSLNANSIMIVSFSHCEMDLASLPFIKKELREEHLNLNVIIVKEDFTKEFANKITAQ